MSEKSREETPQPSDARGRAAANGPLEELASLWTTAVDLHQRGHLAQAEVLYKAILSVDARHSGALHLLGVLAHQTGRSAAAVDLIGRAIAIDPGVPQYHFNRGVALQALNEHAGAADAYRHAVRLKPDYVAAYENLGVALQDLGRLEEAREAYERAIAGNDRSPLAHQNLGTLLLYLGRVGEALIHFERVLETEPALPEVRHKRAACLLAQARYREGWTEYEWRHHAQSAASVNPPRVVPFPKWDTTSPLDGKTILVHAEQGIGDEIMFSSCYGDVVSRARHCVIECDPRLVGLFARSFPAATVIPGAKSEDFLWTAELPDIDCRIPAGSLPRAFRNSADEFPPSPARLRVDPDAQAAWRSMLAALPPRPNVGISWTGGKDARARRARSIPLSEWHAIFTASDANFVNLQYGDHSEEIAELHRRGHGPLHTLQGADALRDPDGFLALISVLDLVISIDNSTVFMAGAVGTPVWVLLPSAAEWRWLGNGDRSIWYPAARLFRQHEPGLEAWRKLLRAVARELPRELGRPSRPPVPPALPPGPAAAANRSRNRVARPAAERRAVLVNDTSSWYHWGCSCTSLAIHRRLRGMYGSVASLPIHRVNELTTWPSSADEFDDDGLFERFAARHGAVLASLRQADVVYVNGEGTLHNVNPQALRLLYLTHVASKRLGLPVHLINHSCYPDDEAITGPTPSGALYAHVYRGLARVAVREQLSAAVVRAMGIEPVLAFDCLPLFVRDEADRLAGAKPTRGNIKRVVLAGSVAWGPTDSVAAIADFVRQLHAAGFEPLVLIGANAFLAADDVRFVAGLQARAAGHFRLVNANSEVEWLRTIAGADLLVSGRFHHSIAAAFLDTPFLAMESNTPKVRGLLEMLQSSAFVSISEPNLVETLLARARACTASPGDFLVRREVKERLLDLAERNFAAAG